VITHPHWHEHQWVCKLSCNCKLITAMPIVAIMQPIREEFLSLGSELLSKVSGLCTV